MFYQYHHDPHDLCVNGYAPLPFYVLTVFGTEPRVFLPEGNRRPLLIEGGEQRTVQTRLRIEGQPCVLQRLHEAFDVRILILAINLPAVVVVVTSYQEFDQLLGLVRVRHLLRGGTTIGHRGAER